MEIKSENNCLERLEIRLYEKIADLLEAERFDDARQVAAIMSLVGIV